MPYKAETIREEIQEYFKNQKLKEMEKSHSTHYQKPSEKKPDLLESISMLEAEIEAHEAEEKAHHDLAVSKRSKLRSFLLLQKKYDDLLNEVSDGIIADEASGFNGENVDC